MPSRACPPAPYSLGARVWRHDARRRDAGCARGARFASSWRLSIGGMIAQGLAAKRLDLVRAVGPCSNHLLTAPNRRSSTRAQWEEADRDSRDAGPRRDVRTPIMERCSRATSATALPLTPWRRMVEVTPAAGYAGLFGGHRVARISIYARPPPCACPPLVISGGEPRTARRPPISPVARRLGRISSPRRALFALILRASGHLPCVVTARGIPRRLLTDFSPDIGAAHMGTTAA